MKNLRTLLLAVPLALTLTACDKEPQTLSNNKDSLKDAVDSRPHENVRDAAEDTGDAAKKAARDTKDAVKDATH
jgi:hypothetical protein